MKIETKQKIRQELQPSLDSSPTDEQIASALIGLVLQRGPNSSACPSEVARRLQANSWRDLMHRVRHVAAQLAQAGQINVTQRGLRLDPLAPWHGPIRVSLPLPDGST